MKQVKIVAGFTVVEIENKINNFLKETKEEIIDIKINRSDSYHSAMIIYEKIEDINEFTPCEF